jgi:alkylhydroperoxidase family enzyme
MNHRMSWIDDVQVEESREDIAEILRGLGIPSGVPGGPYGQITLNPDVLVAFHHFQMTARKGTSPLSILQREMIATYVSHLNRCVL